jgi:hypothetical protein
MAATAAMAVVTTVATAATAVVTMAATMTRRQQQ